MPRHLPRIALCVALCAIASAACDADRLNDRIAAHSATTAPLVEPATTTTIAPLPKAARPPERASRSAPTRTALRVGATSPDVWTRLARCESGGNPRAIGGKGRYFGAFQFALSTWRSVGMTGNPIDYSYADQLAAAQRLQARSGWGQWPVCSRVALRG